MTIKTIQKKDFDVWVALGLLLRAHHSKKDTEEEFKGILKSKNEEAFLCKDDEGNAVGFMNVSVRYEYVSGAHSSPVGYIEGIFIQEQHRRKGYAKKLIHVAEAWAKRKGCKEIGSDAYVENTVSQAFHTKVGFRQYRVLVHFMKKLK